MPKGDYPTGALVEVLREYKADGGSIEVYEQAKKELKNLMMSLVKLEAAQQSVHPTCAASPDGHHNFEFYGSIKMCSHCGASG